MHANELIESLASSCRSACSLFVAAKIAFLQPGSLSLKCRSCKQAAKGESIEGWCSDGSRAIGPKFLAHEGLYVMMDSVPDPAFIPSSNRYLISLARFQPGRWAAAHGAEMLLWR